MEQCEVCGNQYYLNFEVVTAGNRHVFDCFECAIHKLAPLCAHCGCRIIGHGIEAQETFFCCAHCAREAGVKGASDHVVQEVEPKNLSIQPGSTGGHFS